jgi:hypothetical protein
MSSYGWTYLSRDALRCAENQLSGAGEGVRDEIGFLIIHQRYADHFFPGTSVLHTRMRYALFVPWIYQSLYEEGASGREEGASGREQDSLRKAEIKLAGRLRHERGAIGGDNYPRPTTACLCKLLGGLGGLGSRSRDGWTAALAGTDPCASAIIRASRRQPNYRQRLRRILAVIARSGRAGRHHRGGADNDDCEQRRAGEHYKRTPNHECLEAIRPPSTTAAIPSGMRWRR